jgi:hypothetical protein
MTAIPYVEEEDGNLPLRMHEGNISSFGVWICPAAEGATV